MALNFASGLAAAVDGFTQGRNDEAQFQRQQENDQWVRGQRERVVQEQARADRLRADLAAVPSTKTIPGQAQEDAAGNVTDGASQTRTVPVPVYQQLRQYADTLRKNGDLEKYLDFTGRADELQMREAAHRVTRLEGASSGKSTMEIANMARQIFDNDPFPQRIRSVKDDGAGGVVAEIESEGGQVMTQAFKSPAQILDGLKSMYNPKTWAALQQARQTETIKRQGELLKPRILKPGEIFTAMDPTTGKMVTLAEGKIPAGYEVLSDEQGNTILRKMAPVGGAGSGVGTGSGKGGKGDPNDPLGQARGLLDTAAQKSEDKLQGDQYARANTYLEQIYQWIPNAPAAAAAEAARAVAKNPALMKPQINARTGQIDGVYRAPAIASGQPFILARGYMTPQQVQEAYKDNKADFGAMVREMLAKQTEGVTKPAVVDGKETRVALTADDAKKIQQAYYEAAFDERKRAALMAQAAEAGGPAATEALQRKLALIQQFLPGPAAARAASTLKPALGLAQPVTLAERRRMADELAQKNRTEEQARAAAAPQTARRLLDEYDRIAIAPNAPANDPSRMAKQSALAALARLQASGDFGALDQQTRLEIYKRVNSLR